MEFAQELWRSLLVFVISAVSDERNDIKLIDSESDSFVNGCKNVLSRTGGLSCGSIYISCLKVIAT